MSAKKSALLREFKPHKLSEDCTNYAKAAKILPSQYERVYCSYCKEEFFNIPRYEFEFHEAVCFGKYSSIETSVETQRRTYDTRYKRICDIASAINNSRNIFNYFETPDMMCRFPKFVNDWLRIHVVPNYLSSKIQRHTFL